MNFLLKLYLYAIFHIWQCECSLQEGKWFYNFTLGDIGYNLNIPRSLYKGAQTFAQVHCEHPKSSDVSLSIEIDVVPLPCWDYEDAVKQAQNIMKASQPSNFSHVFKLGKTCKCDDHIILENGPSKDQKSFDKILHPIYTVPHDGFYILSLQISPNTSGAQVNVRLEMKSNYGYLSAADWPLLPFYGFMCIFYVFLGILWLVFSFLQWRDLLRVQFWIGGVILLGMLEKATFYAEYQTINHTGMRVQGAMLFAEWVSCAKRTLARMLVIIVSLGFGIVKPRLGATLHRVVGVGSLYFFLACSEAYLRIIHPKSYQSRDLLVASVPLAVLDSAICWWIFSALVNTTRTLKLRRNEVKLSLYRHFTNTLIFSLVASVFFMLYSIKTHRLVSCLSVWKDLWLDEAYWHILFSCLLLVIMILWRPTNNNQRYAFVPLLDTEDDEEEAQLVNDAYGVKVRVHHNSNKTSQRKEKNVEDDLEWLQEHIKSETALSILDSDEEIVNTRFEVSKMQ